jgi:Cu-Zn family superoxide dismutase
MLATSLALLVAYGTGVAAPGAVTETPSPPPPSPAVSPSPESPPPKSPSPATTPATTPATKARAVIKDPEGRTVGTFEVHDDGSGRSMVTVAAAGLPPGFHGLHVHEKGVCDPKSSDPATGSPFSSAGPHLNSASHPDHRGDLPDLLVGDDGSAGMSFVTDRFLVSRLVTGDGTAVVIHSKPDNKANIPDRYTTGGRAGPDSETRKAGDSGSRIACGVITGR